MPASINETQKSVVENSNITDTTNKDVTVKVNNETFVKQGVSAGALEEDKAQPQVLSRSDNSQEEKPQAQAQAVSNNDALSKPTTTTTTTVAKKTETVKTEEVKLEEPKSDEPINLDNLDDNQNPFDTDDNQFDSVDKDSDTKVDNPYPDDYDGDSMARDNNKANDKIVAPEANEISRKKIEVVDFQEDPDSNFFAYLCALMFLCVVFYILHQNRHKILACILEGRRGNRRGRERSRGGSNAGYKLLDCNLEEAITSKKSLSGKSMDIIY